MFEKAKKTIKRVIFHKPYMDIDSSDVVKAREYIAGYWEKLERYHPKDDDTLMGLPNPYLVPAYEEGHQFDLNELYYWDNYFMIQSILDDGHKDLVLGILDNLISLYKRFKVIPNASRLYLTGRSQPPLLTSYIFDCYDAYGLDKKWLKEKITTAEEEYKRVWMGTQKPHARNIYQGLSRYYDINMINDLAECESGWDHTTRFNRKILDYLPVDLNALLYKYETDFARAAKILGNEYESRVWLNQALSRKKKMNDLMWNSTRGFYYDYNYVKEKRGNVSSLAGFYPMWAGMIDDKRAKTMVKALRYFENKGGLSTTDMHTFNQKVLPNPFPAQWSYPNGWAPLHYIVIKGLQRYGYHDDAKRIAMKWLHTNLQWFNTHGVFLEKYNVVNTEKPPQEGVYPSQVGFGWTNAVFERLCQDYIDK